MWLVQLQSFVYLEIRWMDSKYEIKIRRDGFVVLHTNEHTRCWHKFSSDRRAKMKNFQNFLVHPHHAVYEAISPYSYQLVYHFNCRRRQPIAWSPFAFSLIELLEVPLLLVEKVWECMFCIRRPRFLLRLVSTGVLVKNL